LKKEIRFEKKVKHLKDIDLSKRLLGYDDKSFQKKINGKVLKIILKK
jgi:hypothetical protein